MGNEGGGGNGQALKSERGKETVRQILKFYKGGWKAPHSLRLKDSAYKIPGKKVIEKKKAIVEKLINSSRYKGH